MYEPKQLYREANFHNILVVLTLYILFSWSHSLWSRLSKIKWLRNSVENGNVVSFPVGVDIEKLAMMQRHHILNGLENICIKSNRDMGTALLPLSFENEKVKGKPKFSEDEVSTRKKVRGILKCIINCEVIRFDNSKYSLLSDVINILWREYTTNYAKLTASKGHKKNSAVVSSNNTNFSKQYEDALYKYACDARLTTWTKTIELDNSKEHVSASIPATSEVKSTIVVLFRPTADQGEKFKQDYETVFDFCILHGKPFKMKMLLFAKGEFFEVQEIYGYPDPSRDVLLSTEEKKERKKYTLAVFGSDKEKDEEEEEEEEEEIQGNEDPEKTKTNNGDEEEWWDDDEDEAKICAICLTNRKTVILLPCWHYVTCHDCFTHIKKCPICRVKIDTTITTAPIPEEQKDSKK